MARLDPSPDPVALGWPQVHAFRMARHHLDRPLPKSRIAQAVADACGVQAQVMTAAQLALRARIRGLTPEDVDRALWQERSLVRVWCMRGTVHIVPSDEFAVFVRGSSTRQEDRIANWMTRAGAPKASVDRIIEAASAAWDRPRNRSDVAARIQDALGWPIEKRGSRGWGGASDVAGFRLGTSVVTVPDLAFIASYRGLACFGPDDGQGTTFVRPDTWLRSWRDLPLEEAEDALLRRYLHAFGPATASDFAAWSILTTRRAREIWSRVEDELSAVSLHGHAAWVLRTDLPTVTKAKTDGPAVRLLPYFDSYLMGHKERRHLLDAAHHKRIYRPAGWVYPAVLVDGRVAGEWSYARRSRRLDVHVRPYAPLSKTIKDLVRGDAEDIARFFNRAEARVSFTRAR